MLILCYIEPFTYYLLFQSGDSPLLAACGANAIDIVTKLIDNGADIHKSNEV